MHYHVSYLPCIICKLSDVVIPSRSANLRFRGAFSADLKASLIGTPLQRELNESWAAMDRLKISSQLDDLTVQLAGVLLCCFQALTHHIHTVSSILRACATQLLLMDFLQKWAIAIDHQSRARPPGKATLFVHVYTRCRSRRKKCGCAVRTRDCADAGVWYAHF